LRFGHIELGGTMTDGKKPDTTKADTAKWVDESSQAIGLPIAPEYRANVILNVERSLAIVQPLLAIELDEELTPLPVYRP
jgi:hypothetical protein